MAQGGRFEESRGRGVAVRIEMAGRTNGAGSMLTRGHVQRVGLAGIAQVQAWRRCRHGDSAGRRGAPRAVGRTRRHLGWRRRVACVVEKRPGFLTARVPNDKGYDKGLTARVPNGQVVTK